MEMEPIYVPSNKLERVCHGVLGFIADYRQCGREEYVIMRRKAHNEATLKTNRWRKWIGLSPKPMVSDQDMERLLHAEAKALPQPLTHPMFVITGEYGQVEADCKDVLIQCTMTDSVAINQNFARAISHMGVDTSELRRQPFGFRPRG